MGPRPSGPRMNYQIRIPQIRLIASDGKQLGLFSTDAAIKMAQEEGLDLVEIDPNAKPPVCKIMDYGKFKYTKQKQQHQSRKNQVIVHLKEIKLRPNIGEHDLEFKVRHVRRFLEEKDKAKITVQFRGREIQHVNLAREVLDKVLKQIEDVGAVEVAPKLEGKNLSMILMPK